MDYHSRELAIALDPTSDAHLMPDIPNDARYVLDVGCGAGQTLIAADLGQFNAIGCELSPEYAAIAERRVRTAAGLFGQVEAA